MEKKTLLFYFLLIVGFLILVYLIISSKILENLGNFQGYKSLFTINCIFVNKSQYPHKNLPVEIFE